MNPVTAILSTVAAIVLLVLIFSGAAVVGLALIPVVLVWLLVKAAASPSRKDLGWLFKGVGIALAVVFLAAAIGGFLFPVLMLLAVFVGAPLLLLKICGNVKPVLPPTKSDT